MDIEQKVWKDGVWSAGTTDGLSQKAQLVFLFGDRNLLKDKKNIDEVRQFYPKADLVGCSTSGEIFDTQVNVDSMTATAVCFNKTNIRITSVCVEGMAESMEAGEQLAQNLLQDNLVHVLVLSDGLNVNGS